MTGNAEMQKMLDDAAEVIARCGITSLNDQSPPGAVAWALTQLGQFCAGLDKVLQNAIANTAIATLKVSCGYPTEEARRSVRDALKQTVAKADEDQWQTFGEAPGGEVIVDIVQRGRLLQWVVARPGTGHVAIVDHVDDRMMWPRPALPWKALPNADDVEAAWANGVTERELFLELTDLFRAPPPQRRVILPEPVGAWAGVLAAWTMGTYVMDSFSYYPLVLLEGPAARGKTRLGKLLIFLGFRGIVTPNPTDAVIFRNRARHRIGIFLDVTDLPGRMFRSDGLTDLLLNSYERDGVVPRMTRPDAPPPQQMDSFAVYGPTVLASNKAIRDDSPLATRCIRVPMPEAGRRAVADALRADEHVTLILRAKLTAWHAQLVANGTELPRPARQFTGRLHDYATPLLQVVQLAFPLAIPTIAALLRAGEEARKTEVSASWEARVATAIWECREFVQGGRLQVAIVREQVNKGVYDEKEQLTSQNVGHVRKLLGFKGVMRGGQAYITWPGEDSARTVYERYAAPDEGMP